MRRRTRLARISDSALTPREGANYGGCTLAFHSWFGQQREAPLTGCPQQVVDALQQLALVAEEQSLSETVQTLLDESWSYLCKRLPMIRYAAFHALDYPIGSGVAESANNLIVERRLKGAAMRGLLLQLVIHGWMV